MAAFQRGISLAEAQQHMESGDMGRGDREQPTYIAPAHLEPVHTDHSTTTRQDGSAPAG